MKFQQQATKDSNELLTFLCQDHSDHSARFALLSLHNSKFSDFTEGFILLLEYIQLITQVLLLNPASSDTSDATDFGYTNGVIYLAKAFHPGRWISFETQGSKALILLVASLIFMTLKYLLFVYIIFVTLKNQAGNKLLTQTWGRIFKVQGRVLSVFITSIWTSAIIATSKSAANVVGFGNSSIKILGSLVLVIEIGFSFLLQGTFFYKLPSKNFLTTKSSSVDAITLLQKFVLQILRISLANASWTLKTWTFIWVNLCLSVIRNYLFYSILPLYNLKALKFQSILLMLEFSLNFSCFFQAVVETFGDSEPDMEFITVLWVIFGILSVKLSHNIMNNLFIKLTSSSGNLPIGSSLLQIHRIIALKYVRKSWDGQNKAKKIVQESYLWGKSVSAHIKDILKINSEFEATNTVDLASKASTHQMLLNYLERLISKYPKDSFLKLYLAYFYAKKLKCFGIAMRIVTELRHCGSHKTSLSAAILVSEIQHEIRLASTRSEDELDSLTYMKCKADLALLKSKMLQQADLQISIYQEFIQDVPDLAKIFKDSQKLSHIQNRIESRIRNLFTNTFPGSYLEPAIVSSEYYLLCNFSIIDSGKYKKWFFRQSERYEKALKDDGLLPENIYDNRNILVTISGKRSEVGKIIYMSRSAAKILGGDLHTYLGKHIAEIMPPSTQNFMRTFWKTAAEKGDRASIDYKDQIFFYNKDGHMIRANQWISIHPYLTGGFYFNMVLRPIISSNLEHMLVRENGEIECASKKLSERLNLSLQKAATTEVPNINSLSEELGRVNETFNIVNSKRIWKNIKDKDDNFGQQEEEEEYEPKTPSIKRMKTGGADEPKTPTTRLHKTGGADDAKTPKSQFNPDAPDAAFSRMTSETESVITRFSTEAKIKIATVASLMRKIKKKYEMSQKEAEKIYHFYSTRGIDLSLARFEGKSQKKKKELFEKEIESLEQEFLCNCKVSFMHMGDQVLKLFTFEEKKSAKTQIQHMSSADAKKLNHVQFDPVLIKTENQEKDISDFLSENEKSDGWIDLRALQSPEALLEEPKFSAKIAELESYTTNENLISPIIKPTIPLFCETEQQITLVSPKSDKNPLIARIVTRTRELPAVKIKELNVMSKKLEKRLAVAASVAGSQGSISSRYKKIALAYKTALNTKTVSKLFKITCALFYIWLLGVFITQFLLKSTLDDTIDSLIVKNDILSNAQSVQYYLIQSAGLLRVIWDLESARLTLAEMGIFGFFSSALVGYGYVVLNGLAGANQGLISSTDTLDQKDRRYIFDSKVKIYENYFDSPDQTYYNLSNFDATNRIVETGLRLITLQYSNVAESLSGFPFIYRNALNGLLLDTQRICNIFSDSVDAEKLSVDFVVNSNLIVTLSLVVFLNLVFLVLIGRYYHVEKTHMLSMTKLNNSRIKMVMSSVKEFQNLIQKETGSQSFFEKEFQNNNKQMAKQENYRKSAGKESLRNPKTSGIATKYLIQAGYITFCFAVLMGIVVWNILAGKNSINFFQKTQNQIYFSDSLKTRAYIAETASTELLSAPSYALIEETPIVTWVTNSLSEIVEIRSEAQTIFQNDDGSYDPEIEMVLYTNGCSPLPADQTIFCDILIGKGVNTGLIYLLNYLEEIIQNRLEKYHASDKSVQALRDIEAVDFEYILTINLIITAQCQLVKDIITQKFDASIVNSQYQRKLNLALCSMALFLIGIFVWVYALKGLKNTWNQFKNVLRAFPAHLILSSFTLKSFLIKSSNGALDFVKNEI